jgi:REP element-mobilizing transposase RayT
MDEDEVRKGRHRAWQIHYRVVFPVKYRRALLDGEVVRIIVETAQGIAQRYGIEFESIGCHSYIVFGAFEGVAWASGQSIQEHYGA